MDVYSVGSLFTFEMYWYIFLSNKIKPRIIVSAGCIETLACKNEKVKGMLANLNEFINVISMKNIYKYIKYIF